MKLYHHPLSGHSHRARLFLSLLGLDHELIEVDLAARAHKAPAFLALSPFGEIPVLEDGQTVIADSNAILVYLARKTETDAWLPKDIATEAEVQRWLSIAAGKLAYGACAARLITVFGASFDADEVISRAHDTLVVVEKTLATRTWLAATTSPSIADVALYSYIARAPEGNVDLAPYPLTCAWLQRVEALEGFVPFQTTPAGLTV
ncbi:glutathione S-transferase family protein [Novosphingobium pokkalii]|uniref:Glutathione S-transferase family protein n=1 Tax=Novosphingobium pokkalii TaxID=1770194 RepID=A0ABV7V5H3_9SPHN|nr:glutathione S-transferase [Novosphingobium pokkalii]GHD00118.1 glutathione S-transferase [Novosphingobium pokkalii]